MRSGKGPVRHNRVGRREAALPSSATVPERVGPTVQRTTGYLKDNIGLLASETLVVPVDYSLPRSAVGSGRRATGVGETSVGTR